MFRKAPQGLKPFLNTLRDGTTEVVPSRTPFQGAGPYLGKYAGVFRLFMKLCAQ